MKRIILGIGIPGSGKTTALKPFAERHQYMYVSPDEIRVELTGNMIDQSRNREVWEEARRRVLAALSKSETVVFDATFAKDFERKSFIQFVRECGADTVHGVFAKIPYEIALERNKARDRVVPEHAMKRIHEMLEKNPPKIEDGFDSIHTLDELKMLEDEIRRE